MILSDGQKEEQISPRKGIIRGEHWALTPKEIRKTLSPGPGTPRMRRAMAWPIRPKSPRTISPNYSPAPRCCNRSIVNLRPRLARRKMSRRQPMSRMPKRIPPELRTQQPRKAQFAGDAQQLPNRSRFREFRIAAPLPLEPIAS